MHCIIGKFDLRGTPDKKSPYGDGHGKQTGVKKGNIKIFIRFIIVKIILLGEEVMHIQQVRVGPVFDEFAVIPSRGF